jgi:hypothetical protein
MARPGTSIATTPNGSDAAGERSSARAPLVAAAEAGHLADVQRLATDATREVAEAAFFGALLAWGAATTEVPARERLDACARWLLERIDPAAVAHAGARVSAQLGHLRRAATSRACARSCPWSTRTRATATAGRR